MQMFTVVVVMFLLLAHFFPLVETGFAADPPANHSYSKEKKRNGENERFFLFKENVKKNLVKIKGNYFLLMRKSNKLYQIDFFNFGENVANYLIKNINYARIFLKFCGYTKKHA